MSTYIAASRENAYLAHHGILGQKWGIRRYQNKDGTLTAEGKKRAHEGPLGIRKTLQEGEAKARRKRFRGTIAAETSRAGLTIGGITGGTVGGSIAGGPVGGLIGMTAGAVIGRVSGEAARSFIKSHSNDKASVLNTKYKMLAQKMESEYSKANYDS